MNEGAAEEYKAEVLPPGVRRLPSGDLAFAESGTGGEFVLHCTGWRYVCVVCGWNSEDLIEAARHSTRRGGREGHDVVPYRPERDYDTEAEVES